MVVHKAFRDYIQEQERTYSLRIKTVAPIGDDEMEWIERVLQKYVLLDITTPVKTILQRHPLEFQDIQNAEVWIIDIKCALPVSAYVLRQELKLVLNLPEKFIVVRGENDPMEIETQRLNALNDIDAEAVDKQLSPASRLSTNSAYDKDERGDLEEPIYGNEYNSKFLETLAKVAAEREPFGIEPASDELDEGGTIADSEKIEDANAFNKDIGDAPKPKSANYADTLKNLRKEGKIGNPKLSTKGNYDDDEVKTSKKFDKYGKTEKIATVTITNKRSGIRK